MGLFHPGSASTGATNNGGKGAGKIGSFRGLARDLVAIFAILRRWGRGETVPFQQIGPQQRAANHDRIPQSVAPSRTAEDGLRVDEHDGAIRLLLDADALFGTQFR